MKGPADRIGRNDLCPCGSGKKYKHCHEGKGNALTVWQRVGLGLIAVVAAAGLYLALSNRAEHRVQTSGVWSAEHGHYH
jgi:hypothetical protein